MPLTRRAPKKASSKASSSDADDSDTGTDTELNAAAPAPAAKHSKGENKLKKLLKRLIFGTMLLWTQIGIIAAGHLPVLVEVQLIQIAMFRELVNVRYRRIHKDVPLFRTTQWGWFYAAMLYSYGKSFSTDQRLYCSSSRRRRRRCCRTPRRCRCSRTRCSSSRACSRCARALPVPGGQRRGRSRSS